MAYTPHPAANWSRREPGLDSLVDWIDSIQRRSPNQRWGIWGGIVGGSGGIFIGALPALLMTTLRLPQSSPIVWIPAVAWVLLAAVSAFWVVKKNREEFGAWTRDSKSLMMRLFIARWHGNLRQTLGDGPAEKLNEAAQLLMQSRSVLDSEAWRSAAAGSVWGEMRDKALRSLDGAMAQMVILATSGAPPEELQPVILDMTAMKEEVTRAAQRHASVTGALPSGSEGLRQALAEMRELNAADSEYLEQRLDS